MNITEMKKRKFIHVCDKRKSGSGVYPLNLAGVRRNTHVFKE